ncbi:unnamed protein product [Onchocerca ochengi]|uniref:DUF5641 domain-containing protein n=1 Tax=Onchocerca ochengi TaxID=42157 RepID=A0A182EXD2_ONCOC|nr:unnamed protein product [Onchocerca ochengi]
MGCAIYMFYYESGSPGDSGKLGTYSVDCEVGGVLNTRIPIYVNFDDCKIIRPIDFIQPKASLIISTTDDVDEFKPGKLDRKEGLIKYWMVTLKVLAAFWEIWKREYLTSLRERTQKEDVNPENSNDRMPIMEEIVLVDESETPRGLWKLAKVEELKKVKDGVVRTALVEMPNDKYLTMPVNINKLDFIFFVIMDNSLR